MRILASPRPHPPKKPHRRRALGGEGYAPSPEKAGTDAALEDVFHSYTHAGPGYNNGIRYCFVQDGGNDWYGHIAASPEFEQKTMSDNGNPRIARPLDPLRPHLACKIPPQMNKMTLFPPKRQPAKFFGSFAGFM